MTDMNKSDLQKAYLLYKGTQPSLEAVKKLGKFIYEKETNFPGFMEKLALDHPDVSYNKLEMYRRIGEGTLYPSVMINIENDNVRRILDWDYKAQENIMESGVDVLRGDEVVRMAIFELNPKQRYQALNAVKKRVRSVVEQRAYLYRPSSPRIRPNRAVAYMIDHKKQQVFVAANRGLTVKETKEVAVKMWNLEDALEVVNSVSLRNKSRKTG